MLLRADDEPDGDELDEEFAELKAQFGDRALFVEKEWDADGSDNLIKKYQVPAPPALVFTDAGAKIVKQFDKAGTVESMKPVVESVLETDKNSH